MRARWTTNLLLKALALLLALFLWNLYRTETLAVRSLTVPIEFENLAEGREVAGDLPGSITVEVEAPEPLARTLSPEWIDAIVDLREVGIGARELALGPDVVRLPAGARLLSVSPASIALRIEPTTTKQVPIEPRVRGTVKDGFQLMVYCTDDPIAAKRFEEMGCVAVMPLAAPIGSGLGIQNRYNILTIVENAKVPILVDAGVGTASDAAIAMELGCDGVLMNTAIAEAKDPVLMASAMKHAIIAGREAFLAGRMPRRRYASASSPTSGLPF